MTSRSDTSKSQYFVITEFNIVLSFHHLKKKYLDSTFALLPCSELMKHAFIVIVKILEVASYSNLKQLHG